MSIAEFEPKPQNQTGTSAEELLRLRFARLRRDIIENKFELPLLPSSIITEDPEWQASHTQSRPNDPTD